MNAALEPGLSPIAHVRGAPVFNTPKDLYIPPEALEVFLETFEGPLDLLLYLIRRENLNVLDIPMSQLTQQYLAYVRAMREHQLELAGEYLLMAALLIDIKSRMLLPAPVAADDEAADPRAELVRRLVEYEQMKQAAQSLDQLPQAGRDFWWVTVFVERIETARLPDVSLQDLQAAWLTLAQRASVHQHHALPPQELSIREVMSRSLRLLREREAMEFLDFFEIGHTRARVVLQFLALLELCKEAMVELVQERQLGALYVRLAGR